jgi:hypothetical protein
MDQGAVVQELVDAGEDFLEKLAAILNDQYAATAALEARVVALEGDVPPPQQPTRDAKVQPFTSGAWQNIPLGSEAVYTDANDPRTKQFRSFNAGTINSSDWSYPVFIANANQPRRLVTEFDNNGRPTGDTATIYLGDDVVPCGPNSTDKPVLSVQPDDLDIEIYKFTRWNGMDVRTTRLERVDLQSDGSGTGAIASSTPAIGGLITNEDLASGHIPHILKMSLPDGLLKSGFVYPARSQDANHATAYQGQIPMGTLFALPPDVDVDALGLTFEGAAIGHALQDYGAYVLVRASTACLFVEGSNPTDKAAVNRAIADWKKLIPKLVAVDGSTRETPGGPGTRRAPMAAPLASELAYVA